MAHELIPTIALLTVLRERFEQAPSLLIKVQLDEAIENLEALAARPDELGRLYAELDRAEDERWAGRALQGFLNRLQEYYVRREDLPAGRACMIYQVVYRLYDEAKQIRRYG